MGENALRRTAARLLPQLARRDAEIARLRHALEGTRQPSEAKRVAVPSPPASTLSAPWRVPPRQVGRRLLRESGLVDPEWYAEQVTGSVGLPAIDGDPVVHYLRHGAPAGLSPHPAFSASWYVAQLEQMPLVSSMRRARGAPMLHYLTVGAANQISPHPAFDAHAYAESHPEALALPGGPLAHFLRAEGAEAVEVPDKRARIQVEPVVRDLASFLQATRRVGRELSTDRGHFHLERDLPDFDAEAEAALKGRLRREVDLPNPAPLVSVVVPTRDRADVVGETIDSVLAQSYEAWELIVVDDGSTDETAAVLATYNDPRIRVLGHPTSRGVAAARNTGLASAEGRWVAYLDSDNTWTSDFLEMMVRAMIEGAHRVVYGTSALVEQGGEERRLYRGMPFSRQALRERNFIDCIVLVHERSLLEETGGFDESLRRTVDWDLFIRLAEKTDFVHVPVIATEYDVWHTGGSRITTEESVGYRHVVLQRTLVDWEPARASIDRRVPGLTSVIVVARSSSTHVLDTVRRCLATTDGAIEIVVVDSRLPEGDATRLRTAVQGLPEVSVHRHVQPHSLEVARNHGATLTRGEHLVFLAEGAWCEPGWREPLVESLDRLAAAQPLTLRAGGTVWSAGVLRDVGDRRRLLHRGSPGDSPEVRGTRVVDGVTAACLAVDAATFFAVDGFDPLVVDSPASAEFSLRAAEHTGRPLGCVGSSLSALLLEPYRGRDPRLLLADRTGERLMADRWHGEVRILPEHLAEHGLTIVGEVRDEPGDPDPRPLLLRDRPAQPQRWAIKICPVDVPSRENWGDWHFAEALRDSLEALGHQVVIDCRSEWYRPTSHLDDVNLVIRGLHYFDPSPDQLNLTWIISHSDLVTAAELHRFDAVFGASDRWCRSISRRLTTPARPLLQCTDQRRFHPVTPVAEWAHPVLAVANARGIRPSVRAALDAGIVPDVYGVRWEGLLPPGAWRGPYVPNHELVARYVSAGLVLNDHHADMRAEGFVSNRVFDLTACGARVLSDHMPEIEELFGGVVRTWREPADVRAAVEHFEHESDDDRALREECAAMVRRNHTFDARAKELSEVAARLAPPRRSV